MKIFKLRVSENDADLVKNFLDGLGIAYAVKDLNHSPNAGTITAMNELREVKGVWFKNVEELFDSI